jgi:hypothetical protein
MPAHRGRPDIDLDRAPRSVNDPPESAPGKLAKNRR